MGRLHAAAARIDAATPASKARTPSADVGRMIEACRSEDENERQIALRNLCTCHVQADDDDVWDTLVRMLDDPSPRVRMEAVHAVTDSTPRTRIPLVVDALESHRNDVDLKIRRRIRKTLAHYRRTGKITDSPS